MATTPAVAPAVKRREMGATRFFTTFPFAIGSLLAVGVFATVRDLLPDPDIFWHLRDGQYIVTHLRLVSSEMYSFTVAGSPWVSHEWLSEVLYYGAYRAFGWQGVLVLYTGLMIAIVLIVYWLARREGADPLVAAMAAALGKLLLGVGAGPRMQHFGWLCFLAIFAILQKYRRERAAPLWALPLLFCLWVNLHGSWLLGAAACALVVLSGLVPRDIGNVESSPWTRNEFKKLLITGAACVAALFVHPTGYKAMLYPFQVIFRMPLQQRFVIEWQPVNFAGTFGTYVILAIGITFLVAIFGKNRWRIDEVLLTLFVFYLGLSHQRLMVLAGILLPIILARHIGSISSYRPTEERRRLNFAVSCLAALAIVALFPSQRKLQAQIDKEYPAAAVTYIRSHNINGRMFNLYAWGGYLEWSLPEIKTFIDGRGDVFEFNGVLADYLQAVHPLRSREVLDYYRINFVLINPDAQLAYVLNNTNGWRRTYQDGLSAIFERAP